MDTLKIVDYDDAMIDYLTAMETALDNICTRFRDRDGGDYLAALVNEIMAPILDVPPTARMDKEQTVSVFAIRAMIPYVLEKVKEHNE